MSAAAQKQQAYKKKRQDKEAQWREQVRGDGDGGVGGESD